MRQIPNEILSTAVHNRATIITCRHSGMLLTGIQKSLLYNRPNGHELWAVVHPQWQQSPQPLFSKAGQGGFSRYNLPV